MGAEHRGRTSGADRRWLSAAIELSRRCPPTDTAYAVGAIVVDRDGAELARGYSRDSDPRIHAEESALARLAGRGVDLTGATIYSSMEPCSVRKLRRLSCTGLILAAGIRQVVFALREPPIFVICRGAELLRDSGVEVIEIADLDHLVLDVNVHLLRSGPVAGRTADPVDLVQ